LQFIRRSGNGPATVLDIHEGGSGPSTMEGNMYCVGGCRMNGDRYGDLANFHNPCKLADNDRNGKLKEIKKKKIRTNR